MALESVFNPQRAPAHKTMGLLQRSFLDLVESSQQDLQIALVVDGTDSMATDIEGVRNALRSLVADLRQYKGDHVSLALIVYRDSGSPSGEVTLLHSQFTTNEQALAACVQPIKPESGAPYFLELPDLGVHEALEQVELVGRSRFVSVAAAVRRRSSVRSGLRRQGPKHRCAAPI